MDVSDLLALIFGILTGIMAIVALFQTRIGKMQSALKDDMRSMEARLMDCMQAMEGRLSKRIDAVKDDMADLRTELKEDIRAAETRLNARIDKDEAGSKIDEHTEAEAV